MFLLSSVSKDRAIEAFANFCTKNSAPADIFNFDGSLPRMRLKYYPLVAYATEYRYSALVEITSEDKIHSQSSLGNDTSQYRRNQRTSDSGFLSSLYEDYSDTRYTDTTVEHKYMDRAEGNDAVVSFSSTGQDETVSSDLWPSENVDISLFVKVDDYRICSDSLLSAAVKSAIDNTNLDNFEIPYGKIDAMIKSRIESILERRYSNCRYCVKDIDYEINKDTQNFQLIYFPYYEFSFLYNGIPYYVYVAAHSQAEGSTGIFGGSKDVVVGDLPRFERESSGIFGMIKERKSRNTQKKLDRDNFVNVASKNIIVTE